MAGPGSKLGNLVKFAFVKHPAAWGVAAAGAAGLWMYDRRSATTAAGGGGGRSAKAEVFSESEHNQWNAKVIARQRAKMADEAMMGRGGRKQAERQQDEIRRQSQGK